MATSRHLLLMAFAVAALTLLAACGEQATDDSEAEIAAEPTPTEQEATPGNELESLDPDDLENGPYLDAIASAPFIVHVAGALPFEVAHRGGDLSEGPSEGAPTTLFLTYAPDEENTFIELRQVNAPATVQSENVEDTELLDGTPAQFHDNDMATGLTWFNEELEVSITVTSGREDNRLPQDALLHIADALETVDPETLDHEQHEAAGLPSIGEAPCEVRQLQPPPDDAPEPDPERIQDWLETARSFNDVAIGPDGTVYISSYRHAAVLIPGDDGSLSEVWWEGVRNTNQVDVHPDGRIVLLQDNGIHFYDTEGAHQKYLSMFDADAGWWTEYGEFGIDTEGHIYVGIMQEQQIVKLDEDCTVLGQWPAIDEFESGAPPMIAVDGDDLIYSMLPSPDTVELRVRDRDGNLIDGWGVDPPIEDAVAYTITDRPGGGVAIAWMVIEEVPDADPQRRAAEDFVIQTFTSDGELDHEWAGSESGADELLARPAGMAITDDSTVSIVDRGAGEHRMRVHRFDESGQFLDEWRLDNDTALCAINEEAARMVDCD